MAEEAARRKAVREGAARRRARQAEFAAKEQAEFAAKERLAQEELEKERLTKERLAKEHLAQEKLAREEFAKERLAREELTQAEPSQEPAAAQPDPTDDLSETDVMSNAEVCEAVTEGQILSRVERRRRERERALQNHGENDGFTKPSAQDTIPTAPSADDVEYSAGRATRVAPPRKPRQKPAGSTRPAQRSGKKYLLQGMTLTTLAVGGISVPLVGTGYLGGGAAEAAQPITESIVGGSAAQVSTPDSLAGDTTATLRSDATSVSEQASEDTTAQCTPEGAQGMRAAFVEQNSSSVVFPLDSGVFHRTSDFGPRTDPIYGGSSYHAGQDYAAPSDTPIYAIADGTVTFAGGSTAGRSPNTIVVEHEIDGKTYESWYVHMWDHGVQVNVGDKVTAGQQIGLVGSNGNSTGPHLHLEIHDPSLGSAEDVETLIDPDAFLSEQGAIDISQLCE